jgi:hypothetical protein
MVAEAVVPVQAAADVAVLVVALVAELMHRRRTGPQTRPGSCSGSVTVTPGSSGAAAFKIRKQPLKASPLIGFRFIVTSTSETPSIVSANPPPRWLGAIVSAPVASTSKMT